MAGSRAKGVIVIGTFDTKAAEFTFLRERLEEGGLKPIMLDAGILQEPGFRPDIAAADVALRGGVPLAELRSSKDRSQSVATMASGAAAIVRDLHAEGRIKGGICLGGGQGSTIGAAALQALPIGTPKILVSTIAGVDGAAARLIGIRDMMLVNSVIDISGLNRISRTIIANAAASLIGMVARPFSEAETLPKCHVGVTMFGVTSGCVTRLRATLEQADCTVFVFAATGVGDRAMEDLVEQGMIDGVVDVTISQVGQAVIRGNHPGGERRLEIAGAIGIPQVVSFGGLDIILCNQDDPLIAEAQEGLRRSHQHSPVLTVVRPTIAESAQIGVEIARKLNNARGPTSVLIPGRGFSEYSVAGGPLFDQDADIALIDSFRQSVAPSVEVEVFDMDINDPAFADALARNFLRIARPVAPHGRELQ